MTVTERVFRVLLLLFPRPFRLAYADDMTQLFLDQLRDARAGRASRGVLRTWLATFADVGRSSLDEHLRGDRDAGHSIGEPPPALGRALGLLGIAGGLVLVAAFVPNIAWPEGWFPARIALFNAGAIAVAVAAVRRYPERLRPPLARAAAAAAILANGAYLAMVVLSIGRPVYPEPDPEFRTVFLWVGVAMWWADVAFGLAATRLPGLARLGAIALAIGSVGAFSGMGHLQLLNGDLGWLFLPVSQVGIALNGLGWILLGLALVRRGRPIPPVPGPAVPAAVSEPAASVTPPR